MGANSLFNFLQQKIKILNNELAVRKKASKHHFDAFLLTLTQKKGIESYFIKGRYHKIHLILKVVI
jgi:hypothetical protein